MKKEQEQELDLTFVKLAQDSKFEATRLIDKSVDKDGSKLKRIWGELYAGNYITREQIKAGVTIAGVALMGILAIKGLANLEKTEDYRRLVKIEAIRELSSDDYKEFIDNYNESRLNSLKEINAAIDELDDSDYKLNGDRADGTHNDSIIADERALFAYSDKDLDAMQLAADKEIEEFKGVKYGR